MDQTARRRRRNLIQNIAIALLSVSAVLLFAQLQLYNLGTSEDPLYLERLTGEGSPSRLREFPAPVRVVLTDSYGRYGSLGFTTNSDGFSALGLREALGSVQHLAPSATDAFRGALSGPSIYFDFLNPLPLQVLAELTGAEGTALEGNARCLLLAAGADGSVHLYVWDGADTVLTGTVASTALSIDSLTEAVSQSGMGSVSFAFEVVEMEPLYGKLFPLSILPTELPQLPVLSAASSISGTDWLLAAFGLVCLAWLVFGKLVLPVGQEGTRTVAQVTAQGSGSGLEHTVSGLLWLRRTGLWRGTVVIHDHGLNPEGLAVAMALAVQDGVELDRSGPVKP